MTSDTIKKYLDNSMSSVLPGLLVSFIVNEDAWGFLAKSHIRVPEKKEKYVMEYTVSKELFFMLFFFLYFHFLDLLDISCLL